MGVYVPGIPDNNPLGFGFATSVPYWTVTSAAAFLVASDAVAMRVIGFGMTVSALRIYVGTSSGNVSVGVYSGTGVGTAAAPSTLKASSGSVACPASGPATISLLAPVTIAQSDWLALAVDNVIATFGISGTPVSNGIVTGVKAALTSSMPLPATWTGTATTDRYPWIATP